MTARDLPLTVDRVAAVVRLPGRPDRRLLDDVSFAWSASEAMGLVGRSGSGKTTLLRLLAGLERPTSGAIRRPPGSRVMVVMQRPEDHFTEATVGEQLASYSRGPLLPQARAAQLEAVGLSGEALAWPLRELSSGQQRLVAVACALATGARFVALDEPMAGLDAAARAVVSVALQRLVAERAAGVLIVSHHPDDLLGLVNRLLILERGRLAYDGPFAAAPLPALAACIAEPEQSLYYALRRQDEAGPPLPPAIYMLRDPGQICAALGAGAAMSPAEVRV